MNRLFFIFFSLFILISCCKKSTDIEPLKLATTGCDSAIYSKIAEETYFYPNGTFKDKLIVKYDIYGNQVECTSYNIKGELCGTRISKYDSNNNLIEDMFYDSKGELTKKILPYRDETGKRVIQNEYKDGNIIKSTKAYFTTATPPNPKIPVDNVGQLVPFEVVEFNKKGEFVRKYSV